MKFSPPLKQFNRILSIFILLITICLFHHQTTAQFACTDALYFTSSSNTNVYRYTPSSNSLIQVSGVSINYGSVEGSAASAITPSGSRLYYNDRVSPRRLRYNVGNTLNPIAALQADDSISAQRNAIDLSGNGFYMLGAAASPSTYYTYTTGGITSTTGGPFSFTLQPSTATAIINGGDFTFDANNVGYLVDQSRNFYRLNFTTNTSAYLGAISGMGTASPNGVGFSGTKLYISTLSNTIYEVDLTTLVATLRTPTSTPTGFSQNDIAACVYPNIFPTVTAAKAYRNVTKSDPTTFATSSSANPGDTLEYRVVVRNTGSISAGNTTFLDNIPSGVTYTADSTTLNGTAVTDATGTGNTRFFYKTAQSINGAGQGVGALRVDTTPGTITDNEAVIIFRVTVNSPFNGTANPIPNTAQVNYAGASAVVNSNTVNTTVDFPDLTIAKSHSGSFTVGSTGTYSFSVNNSGTAISSGTITVTDTLPIGLTVNSGAVGAITEGGTNAANWTCNSAALTGSPARQTITCTSSTAITASGNSVFNFAVNVGLGTAVGTNSITNTADISGGGEGNTSNNSSSDPTTVVSPDLTIGKSHTPTTFIRGGTGTYNLTIANGGTVATSGTITVVDTLPSGLSIADGAVTLSGTNSANWSCSSTSNVITCTSTTALATSGSSTFGFNVSVASNAAASVTNSVAVSGGNEATANNGNNSTTDATPTIAPPDLTIAKSHTGNFTVGSTGTYSFTATNGGGSASSGTITVTDTLPAGLTVNGGAVGAITEGGTNSANWDCNSNAATPQVITCTSSTAIPNSGTNTSIFNFAVNVGLGTAVGTNSITNNASVSGGGETNTGNNSSSDQTTVLSANLTITKADTANFTVGSTGTYQLTVGNSGTAATSGTITVSDTLPTGLTIANSTFTPSGTNGANWSCTALSNALTCTSSNSIATSGSSIFTFDVNVGVAAPVGTNSISNTATVSGGNEATANNGNNSGSDTTTVLAPDLTIAKSHTPTTFVRGSTGTYNLTVSNSGTASTSGTTTVVDTLPTGLSIADGAVTLSGTNAANWSCNAASNVITCTSTTAIATSSSSTFGFNVNVSTSAATSVVNAANVSGGGEATANNGNNSTTDTTPIIALPDLTLTKSHSGDFTIGSTGTYSFTVTNSGVVPTSLGTITVTDTLPEGLTVNGGAAGAITIGGTNAANWTCSSNAMSPQTVTCNTTAGIIIAASANNIFNFVVNVGSETAVGTNSITNTANVSGGGEFNTANNSASDQTTVLSPDLTIAKSHTGNFTRSSTGTYSMTVTNSGTTSTSGTTTVTDTLPTGLSVNGGAVGVVTTGGTNAANWTCNSNAATPQIITCTSTTAISNVTGSNTSVFNFSVNVASNAAASVTNSVAVSGGNEATVNNGNNTASDPTTTQANPPNVTLAKTCPLPVNCTTAPQLPGTDVTFNIAFTNSGGLSAANMAIVDGVPANTDYKISSAVANVGTTGLTFAIEFSSDYDPLNPTLATWTYTPVSGGGGAPVGYDRDVKAIRWRVTAGTLLNVSPNNTGNVGFIVKIR